jgi:hypothetical protein
MLVLAQLFLYSRASRNRLPLPPKCSLRRSRAVRSSKDLQEMQRSPGSMSAANAKEARDGKSSTRTQVVQSVLSLARWKEGPMWTRKTRHMSEGSWGVAARAERTLNGTPVRREARIDRNVIESAIRRRSAVVSFQPRIYPQPLTVIDTMNPEGIFLFQQYLCPMIPQLLAARPAHQPLAHLPTTSTDAVASKPRIERILDAFRCTITYHQKQSVRTTSKKLAEVRAHSPQTSWPVSNSEIYKTS